MELVVLANSPIGKTGQFFRDVVTQLILDNIQPELGVGGWAARHDLTSRRYQEAFNDYAGNHGMQLMNVSGYGTTVPLHAALWVKTASPPAWQARHGLSADEYQLSFNQLTGQDYRPVLVNGYFTETGPRFACIFQKNAPKENIAWVARHGLTATEYQAFFNHVTEQGYKLTLVCGYSDGTRERYAAIARKLPDAPPWQARHGLTPGQYQNTFDQLGADGYRLELVNGYTVKGQDRIAAIWTK